MATARQAGDSEQRRCQGRSGSPRGGEQGREAEESPSNKGAVRARGEATLEVQGVQCLSARSSALSCKECGGASICEHGRRRSKCKECGGASICEHGRERYQCKECGGASICEHGRRRSQCKECGGGSICEHGRRRSECKECGGASICEHGRRRYRCKECRGA